VIKKGKFVFKDLEDGVYYILLDDSLVNGEIGQGLPIYVDEGKATVYVDGEKVTIGGNPENDAFQKVIEASRPLMQKMMEVTLQFGEELEAGTVAEERLEEMENQWTQLKQEERELIANYVRDNIENPLGEDIFLSYIEGFSIEEIEDFLSNASPALRSNPIVVEMLEQIDIMQNAGVGDPFMDFSLPDTKGKMVALSDYAGKGKYVLIDFWASWCMPCIQEMPVMRKIHDKYRKNLVIIGVSLDEDRTDWLNAINKLQMKWIQLSDYEGDNLASYSYHVSIIPHTVLIDPEGIIIDRDLKGEALTGKLEEVIK
jgi:peroxiredoxin